MPRGKYKRKKKVHPLGALVPTPTPVPLYGVTMKQGRRLIVYVRAHSVDEAIGLARHFAHTHKKVVKQQTYPGVRIASEYPEIVGVDVMNPNGFDNLSGDPKSDVAWKHPVVRKPEKMAKRGLKGNSDRIHMVDPDHMAFVEIRGAKALR